MARCYQTVGLCALLLLSSLGCGSARVVHRNQAGGTIALHGQREEAMKQARQQMLEHCRGPYQIVEEGETVIGETTSGTQETDVEADGSEVSESGQTTRNETEWRIRYVCGGARPSPPAPEMSAPPPTQDEPKNKGHRSPSPDDGYGMPEEDEAPYQGSDGPPPGDGA